MCERNSGEDPVMMPETRDLGPDQWLTTKNIHKWSHQDGEKAVAEAGKMEEWRGYFNFFVFCFICLLVFVWFVFFLLGVLQG